MNGSGLLSDAISQEDNRVKDGGEEEDPFQWPTGPSQYSGSQWGPVSGPVMGLDYGLARWWPCDDSSLNVVVT